MRVIRNIISSPIAHASSIAKSSWNHIQPGFTSNKWCSSQASFSSSTNHITCTIRSLSGLQAQPRAQHTKIINLTVTKAWTTAAICMSEKKGCTHPAKSQRYRVHGFCCMLESSSSWRSNRISILQTCSQKSAYSPSFNQESKPYLPPWIVPSSHYYYLFHPDWSPANSFPSMALLF